MNFQKDQESVLRDLIHTIKQYGAEFKVSRSIFFLFGIPIILYFGYKYASTPNQYVAKASFMLNESGSDNSGIASILGQFGIASPGQQVSLQKIIEIAKTRIIAEKVFLKKVTIDSKEDLLGNHFVAILELNGEWIRNSIFKKDNALKSFRFSSAELSRFSELDRIALKKLHLIFLKKLETSFNEKTGIMELSTIVPNQDLAYNICQSLFDELSYFYIDKTVERQKSTYDKLKYKVDSLRALIFRKDYTLANLKDSYRNTWTYQEVVPQAQTDRDVRTLSLIYGEALKNLEIASFTLQNQTPFIQALDLPLKPLEIRKQNLALNLLKALAFTLIISSIFIAIRKLIRDNI